MQASEDSPAVAEKRGTDELMPLFYDELRQLAARRLTGYPAGTLSATALVHEAYFRLKTAGTDEKWNSDRHFFCAAAEAMRRVLVENARRKRGAKRGGHLRRHELVESIVAAPEPERDLLALDEALTRLECVDAPAAKLVALRCFSGLSLHEAAMVLGVSSRTADRMWAYAKAWLYEQVQSEGESQPAPCKEPKESVPLTS